MKKMVFKLCLTFDNDPTIDQEIESTVLLQPPPLLVQKDAK